MTSPSTPSPPVLAGQPCRARGVELLGELSGSGYARAPGLVRRVDGQTVQLMPVLYRLLEEVDGVRDAQALATRLSDRIDREVDTASVEVLLGRLDDLGLLRGVAGDEPVTQKANPLLALRWKVVVADPRVTWLITGPFAKLFSTWVVVPVLLAFVATTWTVLVEVGVATATRAALYDPAVLLGVVGLTIASAGFHEFGHAAACRYGGARPGAMGAGIYLVWPAFYTDVDDSYRLSRWGRLRVDLGGLYFNALVAVAVMAAWLGTGTDALLLVVVTQLLQMVRQLAPFFRADGYHLLADLTGVPDLFAHMKPTLLGVVPRRWRPELPPNPLKRWARVVVSTWVAVVVPVLVGLLALAVWVLPKLVTTAWDSAGLQWAALTAALGDGDAVTAAARLLGLVALALPVLGIVYLLQLVTRRTVRRTWLVTEDRPRARAAAVLAMGLVAAAVAWAWWPQQRYVPISTEDRGTLPAVVERFTGLGSGPRPVAVAAGDGPAPLPAVRRTDPALAVPAVAGPVAAPPVGLQRPMTAVRATAPRTPVAGPPVPRVLRFMLPEPPGVGDNQALALGNRDGRRVFNGSYALVYVMDGAAVDTENGAYALATCVDCTTTAVAFQVVLVMGDSRVVVPINQAVAVNDQCTRCVTTALAVQVVASLQEQLDMATEKALLKVLSSLATLEKRAPTLGVSGLATEVGRVEEQVLSVLAAVGAVVSPSPPVAVATTDTRERGRRPFGPVAPDPAEVAAVVTATAPDGSDPTTAPGTAAAAPALSPAPASDPVADALAAGLEPAAGLPAAPVVPVVPVVPVETAAASVPPAPSSAPVDVTAAATATAPPELSPAAGPDAPLPAVLPAEVTAPRPARTAEVDAGSPAAAGEVSTP